jgi:hypothetical protein
MYKMKVSFDTCKLASLERGIFENDFKILFCQFLPITRAKVEYCRDGVEINLAGRG